MTQEQFEQTWHFKIVRPKLQHYKLPDKEYIVSSALYNHDEEKGEKITTFAIKAVDYSFFKTGQKHEFLLDLHGFAAKKEGKKLERVDFPQFNETILECIRCKFRQNKKLLMDFAATSLPLTHYYYYGDENSPKIIHLPQYQWIVDELERIREVTKKWLAETND